MDSASLTVSLAMVAGVLAQAVAFHLRVPGVISLLLVGVLLGPDVANVVRPQIVGGGLQAFVGFAVAIILFEGGLQMNMKRLRKQATPIRRLVTVGALMTAAGGAVVAHFVMGWSWSLATLFGTLVIVTGPTVITPLLRRFQIRESTATILEAEGIFIDAVGATIAVVALEVVLVGTVVSAAEGAINVFLRLGVGAAVGVAGGAFLAVLIRWRNVVPEGLVNVLALAVAVSTFQIANSLFHESGITAAIAAGMVIANVQSHAFDDIVEFKEQLTSFFIATLFVLLAADVRVANVVAIAGSGMLVVALLMFVVRPLVVMVSTWKTELTWQQRTFLCWLAPRGIVAAAVASLFAAELLDNNIAGGVQMRALVFLVIAVTVTVQGLSGGIVADWLGLTRKTGDGYLILGANPLARRLALALKETGQTVQLMDSREDACRKAQEDGLDVLFGNGLQTRTMRRGRLESRIATIAMTPNETVNYLYAKHVHEHARDSKVYVALETTDSGVTAEMVYKLPALLLFGGERPLTLWNHWQQTASLLDERWELTFPESHIDFTDAPGYALLPMVVRRNDDVFLIHGEAHLVQGDLLSVLIRSEKRKEAFDWLREQGFVPAKE